jgi:hypothetical protein
MKRSKTSPFVFRRSNLSWVLVFVMVIGMLATLVPSVVHAAALPNINGQTSVGVSVLTGSGGTLGLGAPGIAASTGRSPWDCFMNGYWFVWWVQSTGADAAITWNYVYSADGLTWSSQAALYTTTTPHGIKDFAATCFRGGQSNIIFAWSAGMNGTVDNPIWYNILNMNNPASPVATIADTRITGYTHSNLQENLLGASSDSNGAYYFFFGDTSNVKYTKNGVYVGTLTSSSGYPVMAQVNNELGTLGQIPSNNLYTFSGTTATTPKYTMISGAGGSTVVANRLGGWGAIASGLMITGAGTSAGGSATQCYVEEINLATFAQTELTPTGISSNTCGIDSTAAPGFTYNNDGITATDGGNNVWMAYTGAGSGFLVVSSDGGVTFSVTNLPTTIPTLVSFTGIANNKGQLQALAVYFGSTNLKTVYVTLISLGSSVPITQIQTIGSCTPTATGGFYLANNTQYWYEGNALGQEVASTITTQVENVKGSGSHTLQLMIYATNGATNNGQQPTVLFPAILIYAQSFVITSGTTNNTITLNVNVPLNSASLVPLPFNFWAVGIVGDDHIRIHDSALAGMFTQTGSPSTVPQPASFTSVGNSVATQLQLCATGTYQSVIQLTTTATTTVTSVSTTGGTGGGVSGSALNLGNLMLGVIVILGPALLLGGATKAPMGAMLGAVLGMGVGLYVGIIPFYFIVIVGLAIVAMLFFGRTGSGGGI